MFYVARVLLLCAHWRKALSLYTKFQQKLSNKNGRVVHVTVVKKVICVGPYTFRHGRM